MIGCAYSAASATAVERRLTERRSLTSATTATAIVRMTLTNERRA